MENLSINFLIFFLITYLVQKSLLPKFKEWVLDQPNDRSLHKSPTPSGGGIVFVIVGTLGSCYFKFFIPLICLPLSIIGLVDDKIKLSNTLRYISQVCIVILLTNFCSLKVNTNNISLDLILNLILIISLTAIINFVNFMDGIDGLVAGSMILYLSIFAIIVTPAILPLIAALTAFLIFNWHPSRIFMGDAGSTFLGVLYAGLLLETPSWIIALKVLTVATPLFLDAFFCILRRLVAKDNIFKPHRKHLYQRLVGQYGLTHANVSILYISASISLAFSAFIGGWNIIVLSLFLIIVIGYYLDRKIAKPFKES